MAEAEKILVHAQCSKCGFYLDGRAPRATLLTEEGDTYILHVHYTATCPGCGRLLNLISIEKKPLKKEA